MFSQTTKSSMLIAQKMRSFNYTISDNLEKRQENTMAFTVTRHRTREAAGLTYVPLLLSRTDASIFK